MVREAAATVGLSAGASTPDWVVEGVAELAARSSADGSSGGRFAARRRALAAARPPDAPARLTRDLGRVGSASFVDVRRGTPGGRPDLIPRAGGDGSKPGGCVDAHFAGDPSAGRASASRGVIPTKVGPNRMENQTPRTPEVEIEDFATLFEQSQKTGGPIEEGKVVSGTVIQLTKDYAVVDIGYKSEGQVAISEFVSAPAASPP